MNGVEIFDGNWSFELVKNSNKIWIFGDNDLRSGKGGQAVIRDLNNSIGIRTKKTPSTSIDAYYSDDEYDENCKKIFEDLLLIKSKLTEGNTIVFSKNGYGTGLALLSEKAPKTFLFLCDSLKSLFEFDNIKGSKFLKLPSFSEIEGGQYVKYIKQNEDILIPINNSLFLDHILKSGITNYHDSIKIGKKVAFTSKTTYKKDQILLFSFYGFKDYIVVRVLENSYDITDTEIWSKIEGFKYDFLTMGHLSEYKQTLFSYVCQLSDSGQITFRDDFFSNDVPKLVESKVEENTDIEPNILNEILTQLKEINLKLDKINEKNK